MRGSLPEGYSARGGTPDDIAEIVEFLNRCERHDRDRDAGSIASMTDRFQTPGFDPDRDVCIVEHDGAIAGFEYAFDVYPYARGTAWGDVAPEHRGRGIGTYLVHWGLDRFRENIPLAPPGTRIDATVYGNAGPATAALLTGCGLTYERSFIEMAIDFTGPPPQPDWPDGIRLVTLAEDPSSGGVDDEAAYRAMRDAFRDHFGFVDTPAEEGLARFRAMQASEHWDPTLAWEAMDGDEIAGHNWCFPHADEFPDYGYVASLGVRRPWRKRGLGRALLLHSFGEFHRRGRKGASLGVDAASLTGATRLYESVGMREAYRYDGYAVMLREGEDLAVRA